MVLAASRRRRRCSNFLGGELQPTIFFGLSLFLAYTQVCLRGGPLSLGEEIRPSAPTPGARIRQKQHFLLVLAQELQLFVKCCFIIDVVIIINISPSYESNFSHTYPLGADPRAHKGRGRWGNFAFFVNFCNCIGSKSLLLIYCH